MTKAQLIAALKDFPDDMEVFVCNRLGNLRPIDWVCIGLKKKYGNNNPIEAEKEFYESLSKKFIVIRH